jgi:hypothetical protein
MAFRWLLASLLLAGAAYPTFGEIAPQERVRMWRDQQGREIVGRVVSVQGETVILRSEGRDVAIDYAQLSDADQRYLQGKQFAGNPSTPTVSPATPAAQPRSLNTPQPPPPPTEAEPREWTVGPKQIVGAWIGADEEAFYVQTASGETRIGYEVVTSASDAAEVSARLKAAGREDLAQRVVAAYERNTGKSLTPAIPADTTAPITDENAEPPFNQNVNVATEPTDLPARPEKFDVVTADEVFADDSHDSSQTAAESGTRLRNRALLGAFVLVALVSAVLTYGWMSTKRD